MHSYLTLDDVEAGGLSVLVRSDLNVPLEGGRVLDDFRIRSALPTLERLAADGAEVSVMSHLGRPRGSDPDLSLRVVAERMAELTVCEVGFVEGGQINVLENTRFARGETSNSPELAGRLASGVDLFVADAFGSAHRTHASTVGVAELVPSVAGPLLDRELSVFANLLDRPEKPYVVILGGAKVPDKLGALESLLPKVDRMLIGGGMCFTFLASQGAEVGASLVDASMIEAARRLMAGRHADKIRLPTDVAAGREFSPGTERRMEKAARISDGWIGLDIGPDSSELFASEIAQASSVFWNGPMGVCQWERFERGTRRVAEALGASEGFTVVGGGDSAAAVRAMGLTERVSHLSTGGGAGLALLETGTLPGIAVLERWVDE